MIEVGKKAPDFELASHLGGTKFTLNQFKGQKMSCWCSIRWIRHRLEPEKFPASKLSKKSLRPLTRSSLYVGYKTDGKSSSVSWSCY